MECRFTSQTARAGDLARTAAVAMEAVEVEAVGMVEAAIEVEEAVRAALGTTPSYGSGG